MPTDAEIRAAAWAICHAVEQHKTLAEEHAKVALEAAEGVRAEVRKLVLKMPPIEFRGRLDVRREVQLMKYGFLGGIFLSPGGENDLTVQRETHRLFLLEGEHQWLSAMDTRRKELGIEPIHLLVAPLPAPLAECSEQCNLWHRAAEGEPWRLTE
jgi:hypothetical protein